MFLAAILKELLKEVRVSIKFYAALFAFGKNLFEKRYV
jgi:hypothetical protein